MSRGFASLALAIALPAVLLCAEAPQAEITNGLVKARLYLPDPQNGYYRATRFDWSGVIATLETQGHNYFGQWFERYDPKLHDAITGPVEEFLTGTSALGFDEVKPGESFVKIGVGALRKPDEPRFQQFQTYEITDSGKWTTRQGPGWIEFTQELSDTAGYAYVYRKTVRLTPQKPELVLEHSLRNTGRKPIASSVYQHNFFMIDGLPTGPDISIRFPFEPRATRDLGELAAVGGKEISYLKELQRGQTVFTDIQGYGSSRDDYDIRVENRKAGAGVRQTSDRPIAKLVLWSPRTTVCPEAFIDLHVEPGQETTWKISYEFYNLRK